MMPDLFKLIERQSTASAELSGCETFPQIAEVAARYLLSASNQFITLSLADYHPDGRLARLQVVASANRERVFLADGMVEVQAADLPIFEAVINRAEPRLIADVSHEADLPDTLRQWFATFKIQSLALLPMCFQGHVIGLLGINSTDQPVTMSKAESQLFQGFVAQVSAQVQAANLIQQPYRQPLEQQVSNLKAISQITEIIISAHDEQTLLDQVSESLVRLLPIDHCGILLATAGDEFGVVASEYPDHQARGVKIPVKDNPAWNAIVANDFQPLVLHDLQKDERVEPATRETSQRLGIHAMAILPIVVERQIVGGVGLDIYSPDRSITPDMVEVAQIITAQLNVSLRNLRLLKEVQYSAEQLTGQVDLLKQLNQMVAELNTMPDRDQLLRESCQKLCQLLQADHVGVVLADEPNGTWGTVVSEYPNRQTVGERLNLTENPVHRHNLRHPHQPFVINHISQNADFGPDIKGLLERISVHSIAILPLMLGDTILGSVGVDMYNDERVFTPDMVEVAQSFTNQIAIVMENLRLLHEAERRAQQLQHVNTFSQSVQSTFDLGHILQAMLTESQAMLPNNQISILLHDPVEGQLRTVAQASDNEIRLSLTNRETVPMDGPLARVWKDLQPVYLPDLREVAAGLDAGITMRSWLLVPLVARGRPLGVVSVGADRPHAYSPVDISVFSQMANQLASIIESVDVYQQSVRVARNESLVNEISSQLQRQMDINSMMQITAEELGKALGARRARIRLGVSPQQDEEV